MSAEFKYLKDAVAADMIRFLVEDFNLSLSEALEILFDSETYNKLCNPSTGLYFRGSKYVYSFLKNELQTGVFS